MRGFNTYTIEGDIVHIQIKDRVCLIDLADLELVSQHRWHLDSKGYATTSVSKGRMRFTYTLHRLLMGFPEVQVDHADRNKLNNCRQNLRLASGSQNKANVGISTRNSSGYKGVSWDNRSNKWRAQISYQNKLIYLGLYLTKEEAFEIRKTKALELFGEFACNG